MLVTINIYKYLRSGFEVNPTAHQILIRSLKLLTFSRSLQQLFNCQLLYRLSLPDNDLAVLPPGIANLINLRELDVSKNSKKSGQFISSFFVLFGV